MLIRFREQDIQISTTQVTTVQIDQIIFDIIEGTNATM